MVSGRMKRKVETTISFNLGFRVWFRVERLGFRA